MKKRNNWLTPLLLNAALAVYICLILTLVNLPVNLFTQSVQIGLVLIIMFVLELLSTLTFQARIKLTAKQVNEYRRWRHYVIPTIAGTSWLIAGFEGLLLINDSDTIEKFLIKIPPVFIATWTGVFLNLRANNV